MVFFLRRRVLSIETCVSQHIARSQNSANEHGPTMMKLFRDQKDQLHDITSVLCVFNDVLLDVTRVFLSLYVLLPPCIVFELDKDTKDVPDIEETPPANSRDLKKTATLLRSFRTNVVGNLRCGLYPMLLRRPRTIYLLLI